MQAQNQCWVLDVMPPDACQSGCGAVFDAHMFDCCICFAAFLSDARVICAPSCCIRMLLLEEVSTGAVARLVWVPIGWIVSRVHAGHFRVLIVQRFVLFRIALCALINVSYASTAACCGAIRCNCLLRMMSVGPSECAWRARARQDPLSALRRATGGVTSRHRGTWPGEARESF